MEAVADIAEQEVKELPVEFFAAKDTTEVAMFVPKGCGLRDGDTLRVDGLSLTAMRGQSVLALDLPDISQEWRARLAHLAENKHRLPVGEFFSIGLTDAYCMHVVVN